VVGFLLFSPSDLHRRLKVSLFVVLLTCCEDLSLLFAPTRAHGCLYLIKGMFSGGDVSINWVFGVKSLSEVPPQGKKGTGWEDGRGER